MIIIEEGFNSDFQWQKVNDNNYCYDIHFYHPWDFVNNNNTSPYNLTANQLKQDLLSAGLQAAINNNVPLNIGEYGIKRKVLERAGSNWLTLFTQLHNLFDEYSLIHQLGSYYANEWGLHEPYSKANWPNTNNINRNLYNFFKSNMLAIESKQQNSEGYLYPNPTTYYINISKIRSISKINIYNVLGECVLSVDTHNSNSINVYGLPHGIYYMEILTKDKVYYQKFIKQ